MRAHNDDMRPLHGIHQRVFTAHWASFKLVEPKGKFFAYIHCVFQSFKLLCIQRLASDSISSNRMMLDVRIECYAYNIISDCDRQNYEGSENRERNELFHFDDWFNFNRISETENLLSIRSICKTWRWKFQPWKNMFSEISIFRIFILTQKSNDKTRRTKNESIFIDRNIFADETQFN